jgi:DNA-binding NarL/FixJ family response regulator
MTIKLIVADPHEVTRKGLASLLADEDVTIVAQAVTGAEAISKTRRHKPDVLLMEVRLPGVDGLDALEKIRDSLPKTQVIIMSTEASPTYLARAVALGAAAFLHKNEPAEVFVAAIKAAARGEPAPADSAMGKMKAELDQRLDPETDDVPLTKREYQVLRHLAHGLSNREIAKSLKISIETVKEYVQNLLWKMKMKGRTEAAVWALKRGLI